MSRLSSIIIADVVRKLVGPIEPLGDSGRDAERFQNLETLTDLVHTLLMDLRHVARNRKAQESSVYKAGDHATKFLSALTEEYGVEP